MMVVSNMVASFLSVLSVVHNISNLAYINSSGDLKIIVPPYSLQLPFCSSFISVFVVDLPLADGRLCILVNRDMVAQDSQFSMKDVKRFLLK